MVRLHLNPQVLQGTTLWALEETETRLLWKGLILLWCPAPGRALHPGNQKLTDTATFSPSHGMLPGSSVKSKPPTFLDIFHCRISSPLKILAQVTKLTLPLSRHIETHLL